MRLTERQRAQVRDTAEGYRRHARLVALLRVMDRSTVDSELDEATYTVLSPSSGTGTSAVLPEDSHD